MNKPSVSRRITFVHYLQALTFMVLLFARLQAKDVCELVFTSCPENFDGDTIVVSDDIVALSAEVMACKPTDVREGVDTSLVDSGGPPSIMLVIDNSGSMTRGYTENNIYYPPRDQWGSRYTVVADLLDTLYKMHPDAEVGIAVFRDYLYFDTASTQDFAQLFTAMPTTYDDNPNQAYLPPLKLNQIYYKNKTGIEIIKEILTTDTITSGSDTYVDLVYTPTYNTQGYTNINIGFLAARQALGAASYPKERRFILFFSDGYANDGNGKYNADRDKQWYTQGEQMPTTFTVFFTDAGQDSAHPDIYTMANSIRTNNYSTSNALTDVWTVATSHQVLLNLLAEKVLGYIVNLATIVSTGVPTAMQINEKAPQTKTDTSFVFAQRFGLEPNTSKYSMTITYRYTNQRTKAERDTTITVTFYVKREAGATLPAGVSKICWTQPTLDLLYGGISVLGDTVNETMDKLQVQLTPNDLEMNSATVTIGSEIEKENLSLTLSQAVWEKEFLRYVSETGSPGDLKLQHKYVDEITVVWRNPNIPLDTVMISVPFSVSRSIAAQAAYYFDNNADGYIDSIYVQLNVDSLLAGDIDQLKNLITLPSTRSFSNIRYVQVPGGFAILVEESKNGNPRTDVDAGDIIKLADGVFTHGGIVKAGSVSIQDKVAPVVNRAILVLLEEGDSLYIEFSEPVAQVTFQEPFKFRTKSTTYRVSITSLSAGGGENQSFRVANVDGVDDMMPGDSVWIHEGGYVVDNKGNKQVSPLNRRALLEIKQPPYKIVPKAVNNPYDFDLAGTGQEPPAIRQSIQYVNKIYALPENSSIPKPDYGPIIVVQPQGAKLRESMKLSGTVTIFDVVKNLIIENHPMAFDPNTKQLVYMWNGVNKNGKKVATGTYVAVMTISDNLGMKETRTVRIGVKR